MLRSRLSFETGVHLFVLAASMPMVALSFVLLFTSTWPWIVRLCLAILLLVIWWLAAKVVRERLLFPIRTLTNVLAAFREGDYSLRARAARAAGSVGDMMKELNSLGDQLTRERRQATEAHALLQAVMNAVEIALFTFDAERRLRLVNPAGAALLQRPENQLIGCSAADLGLAECLNGSKVRVLQRDFPGKAGTRWELKRTAFREGGVPHQLLVLTDVGQTLREEERSAWQRLIRVLGHEINNSLAPIKSISESLRRMVAKSASTQPQRSQTDLIGGLEVIEDRASSLNRFLAGYTRLARLPSPTLRPIQIAGLIGKTAALETRLSIVIEPGPDCVVFADADQLAQALINLVQNAVDACLETNGSVVLDWSVHGNELIIRVVDRGPGISDPANLFVPFFTTKSNGTGIGLVLSRQITEAHGGVLALENRTDSQSGCIATIRLPAGALSSEPTSSQSDGSSST